MSFKRLERRMSTTLQLGDCTNLRGGSVVNMEPLEEIVMCPIDLELLKNPRQLPCGHAFCLECLTKCLRDIKETCTVFPCPICRTECLIPSGGAVGWPAAFTHAHIVQYIREEQCKAFVKESGSSSAFRRKGSIMVKTDMLKTLAEELATRRGEKVDKCMVISELDGLLSKLKADDQVSARSSPLSIPPSRGPASSRGSYDAQCEIESERQKMRRYATYNMRREAQNYYHRTNTEKCVPSSPGDRYKRMRCADLEITFDMRRHVFAEPNGTIVYFDSTTNSTVRFKLLAERGMFHPVFMRFFRDSIYISGILECGPGGCDVGLVCRCDLKGNVTARSPEFVVDSVEHFPVQGFAIDEFADALYIAKPSRHEIAVLDLDLVETEWNWVLDEPLLNPCYLCCVQSEGEIWATCPRQGAMVILDKASKRYHRIGTDKIFNSIPSHIVYTSDKRICFLDERDVRIFWIQKCRDFLCVQRLSFGNSIRKVHVRIIQQLCDDKIMLGDDTQLFVAEPKRKIGAKSKCCLL